MTATHIGFIFGFVITFVIAIIGHLRWAWKQLREREDAVDEALAAMGKERSRPKKSDRISSLFPNKGYRSWAYYRILNFFGMHDVSRFIWRRRRNRWLIRGFFTRFR